MSDRDQRQVVEVLKDIRALMYVLIAGLGLVAGVIVQVGS